MAAGIDTRSRISCRSGTPPALMRVRKTLYYVIGIDQPKRQIKCSPIFNPDRFRTESPNFLYANISAFTVFHSYIVLLLLHQ